MPPRKKEAAIFNDTDVAFQRVGRQIKADSSELQFGCNLQDAVTLIHIPTDDPSDSLSAEMCERYISFLKLSLWAKSIPAICGRNFSTSRSSNHASVTLKRRKKAL